jgi:signal peptidase II
VIDLRWKAFGAAAAVFALDRLTKWIVQSKVSFIDSYTVIPGFFDIVHSQNSGVAFGMLSQGDLPWRAWLLIALSLVASVVISVMIWRGKDLNGRTAFALAFILGGATGNLVDRVASGKVTDFLLVYVGQYQWPTFNIADSGIVVGSGLLILDLLLSKKRAPNVP